MRYQYVERSVVEIKIRNMIRFVNEFYVIG